MSSAPLQSQQPGISERIAIVNALMAQDRIEVRDHQASIFTLTYYVISGSIAIAVFFVVHHESPFLRLLLIIGQCLLILLYAAVFVTLRKWLGDARACLKIRESFYKEKQRLLYANPFDPLRGIEPKDRKGFMVDSYLWFPFIVTVLVTISMLSFMCVLWVRA